VTRVVYLSVAPHHHHHQHQQQQQQQELHRRGTAALPIR